MAKRRNIPDPHAEREASNYENPVPSREYILEQLKESEKGISQAQLRRQLEIEGEEQAVVVSYAPLAAATAWLAR